MGMEWYEIIGVGGGTLILGKLIDAVVSWGKARADAKKTHAEAEEIAVGSENSRSEMTATTYQGILDEIKENLIEPLEGRLRSEINERRTLEGEVRKIRDECEEDKTAILATLEAERQERAAQQKKTNIEHAAERAEMREIVHSLKIERGELYRGVKVLTGQLVDAGISPQWEPPDQSYYESLTPPIPTKPKRREFM